MSDEYPTTPAPGQPENPAGVPDQPEYLQQGAGTPLPPAAHEKVSGGFGRKGFLIGGAALGGLALAGAGAWAAVTLSGGGPQPTEALPADTLGFVSIDLDPSAGQKIEAMKMLNKFPSFKKEFGLDPTDDIRKAIFDEALKSGSCDGLTYDDDVAPWIGSRAAVAAVNGTDGKPAPVVVLQVSDDGAAETGLAALADCGSSDQTEWVVTGGWAVIAETKSTAQGVVDDAADSNLADDASFQQWMGEVGDPGVVTMYAAPDAVQAFYDAMGTDAGAAFDVSSALANFKGMAGTVRFNDGAVELEAAGPAVDAARTDSAAGVLAATLPADTAAAVSVSFPDGWVEALADQVASMQGGDTSGQELLDQMSTETGMDLPEDLETLTGDAMALSVGSDIDIDALTNASDPSGLPLGLKIQGDAEGIQRVLDKLMASFGADAELLAADAEGDLVALGPNPDYRAELLKDGSLGDSAAFASAVPQGSDSTMVVYVNFDAGDGWLDQLAASDPSMAGDLEPLDSMGLSAWVDGDASHVIMKLTTD